MKQNITSLAKSLFDLVVRAGLLTKESFDEVFPTAKLQELAEGLEGDKQLFAQNNPEIKGSEKLWNEGVDLKISELVSQGLLDFLQNINKAFSVAYDQSVEDIIFNFQSVSTDLNISDLGEKQESGTWYQGMKIGDETFWYKAAEGTLVQDVLHDISRRLFPLSKSILRTNFRDQDQYIVVDLEHLSEFEEFGFFSV